MNKGVKSKKGYFFLFVFLVLLSMTLFYVNAFNHPSSDPSVVGHSAGELDLSEGVNGIASFNDWVGIGTDNPEASLDVQSSSDDWTSIRIKNTESSPGIWELRNMQEYHINGIETDINNGFTIWGGDGGEEEYRLAITAEEGNVGIGTLTPQGKLDVNGDIYHQGSSVHSDKRWKEDIQEIENPLEKVLALQGVLYKWNQEDFPEKDFDNQTHLGFIAQDIEKIVPEVVVTGENGYKYVDYEKLNALLSEAIKEQQKIIKEQERKLEEQNSRISEIEKRLDELEN